MEVESFEAPVLASGTYITSFTVSWSEAPGDAPALIFEWADRQIPVPVVPTRPTGPT